MSSLSPWPNLMPNGALTDTDSQVNDIKTVLRQMLQSRQSDIGEWNNLPQVFVSGRKVGKIPTGSADVISTDQAGDINYDANFLYICVPNAGTVVWRRIGLSTW